VVCEYELVLQVKIFCLVIGIMEEQRERQLNFVLKPVKVLWKQSNWLIRIMVALPWVVLMCIGGMLTFETEGRTWKTKETAISKIASEDDVNSIIDKYQHMQFSHSTLYWSLIDVNCFSSDAEGVIHREFVPEGQKGNAEFYMGFLIGYWREFDELERPNSNPVSGFFFAIKRHHIALQL